MEEREVRQCGEGESYLCNGWYSYSGIWSDQADKYLSSDVTK